MNPNEVMAANLVCGMTGVSKELTEQALANAPEQFEEMNKIVELALNGPFGEVDLGCGCAAMEGVEHVLESLEKLWADNNTNHNVQQDRQFTLKYLKATYSEQEQDPVEVMKDLLEALGFKAVRLQ